MSNKLKICLIGCGRIALSHLNGAKQGQNVEIVALVDAKLEQAQSYAEKYGIDPAKIAIMGSSAGGHLAALTSTYRAAIDGEGVDELDSVDPTPNAQILCYPVIDYNGHKGSFIHLLDDKLEELRDSVTPSLIADSTTPPAYIWHTAEDGVVPVEGALHLAEQLGYHNVPYSLHIFPYGPHGIGLAQNYPLAPAWSDLLGQWLRQMGF